MKIKEHLTGVYWQIEALLCEWLVSAKSVSYDGKKHGLDNELIVSLTSFPKRFAKLHLTIKSLLSQSIKADKIILWLAFDDYQYVSKELLRLEKQYSQFEIKQCEDLRSYKKLIFSLQAFPHAYIVTADDDVYYSKNWLQNLVKQLRNKKEVIAHRVHIPQFKGDNLLPYHAWQHNAKKSSDLLFATGVGGILYPPKTFTEEVFNQEAFMSLCKNADDVWFFWMARLNNVHTVWSNYDFNVINWRGTDESGLAVENVGGGANDACIKNMTNAYGDVFR